MKKTTIAQLRQEISDLKAQDILRLSLAQKEIEKAGADLMGSGAIVSIHAYGGRVIMSATLISDGLSVETIKALKSDIARTLANRKELNQ